MYTAPTVVRSDLTEIMKIRKRVSTVDSTASTIGEGRFRPPYGWICFSGQDWWYHNRAHSDFQLMQRIARHRTVLFVNSIGMRMPLPGRSTQVVRRIWPKGQKLRLRFWQPLAAEPDFYVLTPADSSLLRLPADASAQRLAWLPIQVRVRGRSSASIRGAQSCVDYSDCLGRRPRLTQRARSCTIALTTLRVRGDRPELHPRARARFVRRSRRVLYVSRSLMDTEHAYVRGSRAVP